MLEEHLVQKNLGIENQMLVWYFFLESKKW